jgi:uncharacterized membrane protein YphA (DoxX/SURF4 family)
MADHGLVLLRWSLGFIFLWFGVLKFFPGLSPADELATATVERLTFGFLAGDGARIFLATLEVAIGLGLLFGKFLRTTLLLLFGQMAGTVTPLFLFPDLVWERFPLVLTLEGQYIVKNLVLISAGLAIGASARGGGLTAEPNGKG